jgi:hypothetical protein
MEGWALASPSMGGEKEWRWWSFPVVENGERDGGALIAAVGEGLEEG